MFVARWARIMATVRELSSFPADFWHKKQWPVAIPSAPKEARINLVSEQAKMMTRCGKVRPYWSLHIRRVTWKFNVDLIEGKDSINVLSLKPVASHLDQRTCLSAVSLWTSRIWLAVRNQGWVLGFVSGCDSIITSTPTELASSYRTRNSVNADVQALVLKSHFPRI